MYIFKKYRDHIRNLTCRLAKFHQQAQVSTNRYQDQCATAGDKKEFCRTIFTILKKYKQIEEGYSTSY